MARAPILAAALLALAFVARADVDGDGVEDALDNCAYAANPGQEDSGGLLGAADGIGDACQCGDVDDDGPPDIVDVATYRRELLLLPPGLAAPQKCDVAAAVGFCDDDDVARLRGALAGAAPGLEQICAPARPTPCDVAHFPLGDRFAVDPASGHCYVSFDDDAVEYAAAAASCVAIGGHLATITSGSEDAVVRAVQNPGQNPWIGGSDIAVEGSFAWLTGEPFVYASFAPGEPDDDVGSGGNGDCLHLSNALGQWGDTACGFSGFVSGSICEIETEACGDGVLQSVNSEGCDDGNAVDGDGCSSECARECNASGYPGGDRFAVDPANDHCYVSFDDEQLSFAAATGLCATHGGHLATIGGAAEDAIVQGVQNPGQNPWIGATDAAVEGTFEWVTGEPFGYQDFAPGEPDDDLAFGGNGDCLHLADPLGRWSDTNCSFVGFVTGAICEIDGPP